MTWPRIQEQFRRELSAAKKNRRLMQTDVADRIGKHQSAISKMAHYQYKDSPRVEAFVQAVFALGIPLSEFFRHLEEGGAQPALVRPRLVPATGNQAIITHLRGIIRALETSKPK